MTGRTHPRPVELYEVGPRDGLQNEETPFTTTTKLELIDRLAKAGLRRIEVASFAHPKKVPQMADAEAVIAALPDIADLEYIGLVLNKRGYLRALETRAGGKRGVDQVGCVSVMSETFSQKNQGMSIAENIANASEVLRLAKRDGMSAQVTLSAIFGCPFEGEVPMQSVIDNAKRLAEAEPDEMALADTIGVGVPSQVHDLFGTLKDEIPCMTRAIQGLPIPGPPMRQALQRLTPVSPGWAVAPLHHAPPAMSLPKMYNIPSSDLALIREPT
jgi:hydroxymethylglutaryl-CoA lyase